MDAARSRLPPADAWRSPSRRTAGFGRLRGDYAAGYPGLPARATIDLGAHGDDDVEAREARLRCRFHRARYAVDALPAWQSRRFQCGVDPDGPTTFASTKVGDMQVVLGYNRTLLFSYEW